MATGPMPAEPPRVTLGDVEVPLLSSYWIRGLVAAFEGPETAEEAAAVELPEITVGEGTAEFVIHHGSRPVNAYVELYDEQDEHGHPIGEAKHVDCATGTDDCTLAYGESETRVSVEGADETAVLILRLFYAVPQEQASGVADAPSMVTGTWGARPHLSS